VDVRGRAERQDDAVGLGRLLDPLRQPEVVPGDDPLEQLLGAGLVERHLARLHGLEHARLAVDPDHAQAAVGEGESERQADAAEPHDRDVGGHVPQPIGGRCRHVGGAR
jgi:hypothetical protein